MNVSWERERENVSKYSTEGRKIVGQLCAGFVRYQIEHHNKLVRRQG